MTRLVRTEILKLGSTRASWAIALGALAVVAVGVTAMAAASSFVGVSDRARQVLALAGPVQTFALILGVLAVTSEFRHGTITSALLVNPRRASLVGAKLVALGLAGLVIGMVAFALASAIALPILASRHVASHVDVGDVIAIVGGGALTTALCAVLGVGLGAAVRNQVGAVVAALGFLYVLEPVLSVTPGLASAVQRYGLGGLTTGGSGTAGFPSNTHILGQLPAALVLAGYVALVAVAGTVALSGRDLKG